MMNKNYFLALIILSAILTFLFLILMFTGYGSIIGPNLGIIIFIILIIPFAIGIIGFGATGGFFSVWFHTPDRSVDHHSPLIQNKKAFLKAQPFFCDNCKKFTDTLREICETCGSKNSIRKGKKVDFKQIIKG